MRFHFQFATRGRPRQFNQAMLAYCASLSKNHTYIFNIILDEDDETMQTDQQRDALHEMSRGWDMRIWYAPPGSKVQAINSFIVNKDFDVLIHLTDDSRPECVDFDEAIAGMLERDIWPKLLHCFDGYQMEKCSNPIMNRALYEKLGYIYSPAYESNFAKNDLTKMCERAGNWLYWHKTLIRHEGIRVTGQDATFKRNNSEEIFMKDQETYRKRSAARFPIIPL